jgi:hypothetical protein
VKSSDRIAPYRDSKAGPPERRTAKHYTVTSADLTRQTVEKKITSATDKARCISINRKKPLTIQTTIEVGLIFVINTRRKTKIGRKI